MENGEGETKFSEANGEWRIENGKLRSTSARRMDVGLQNHLRQMRGLTALMEPLPIGCIRQDIDHVDAFQRLEVEDVVELVDLPAAHATIGIHAHPDGGILCKFLQHIDYFAGVLVCGGGAGELILLVEDALPTV